MLEIKILGPGCMNCKRLENLCREVADEKKWDTNIEKITNYNEFAKYGVMMTPGLVVNGKVLSQGKMPVKSTLEHWLEDEIKSE